MSEEMKDAVVPAFDHRRRGDVVLKRFVEGMSIPNILHYLESHHGLKVGRDVPYQDIARATSKRWLQYNPTSVVEAAEKIIGKRKEVLDVYVPSVGEGLTAVSAAAHLCASAIYNIAAAKVRGITLGDREKPGSHWRFPVQIRNDNGELSEEIPLEDVDHGKVSNQNLVVKPMEIIVRLGFSGGNTMANTSRDLGCVIADRVEGWEKDLKKLVFELLAGAGHGNILPEGIAKRRFKVKLQFVMVNLNSGFDLYPDTNPIAFLSALRHEPVLASRMTIRTFNAMPFVEVGKCQWTIDKIGPLKEIREDYDRHGFDIILTSSGCIDDPHSTYWRYYKDPRVAKLLEDAGVVGDFMWLPITRTGPFSLNDLHRRLLNDPGTPDDLTSLLAYRPMTLLNLDDVAKHVANRRDVFCVLAPCGVCGIEKSQVASALLDQKRGLVTHFVLDRSTADATIETLGL